MEYSPEFFLGLVSRWLHILAAITAVGGTIFIRFALLPAMAEMDDTQRNSLHAAIRSRWAKIVMVSIAFLLASGIYNFLGVIRTLSANESLHSIKSMYHAFFGVKFLLALGIFFIASALVGRSSAFDKIRANARFWATLNVALAVLLVCISGFLRMARDSAGSPPPAKEPSKANQSSLLDVETSDFWH